MEDSTELERLMEEGHRFRDEGDAGDALTTFLRVWEEASCQDDDYYACLAAHMLGVVETRWEEKLRWHIESLSRADRVDDGRAREFYPSLYVNLGYVYGNLGDLVQALAYYQKAEACQDVLADDEYGQEVRPAIARGLAQLRRGETPTRQ